MIVLEVPITLIAPRGSHCGDAMVAKATVPSPSPSSAAPTMSAASPSSERAQQRRVHFAVEQPVCHSYTKNYTKADERNLWYNHDDFSDMRNKNYVILKQRLHLLQTRDTMDSSYDSEEGESDDWTWRGFEHLLHEYPRKQVRRDHMLGVLAFQRILRGTSKPSSSFIALSYYAGRSSLVNGSLERARSNGLKYEEASAEIQYEISSFVLYDVPLDSPTEHKNDVALTSSSPRKRYNFHPPRVCSHHRRCHHHGHYPDLSLFSSATSWRAMREFFRCMGHNN